MLPYSGLPNPAELVDIPLALVEDISPWDWGLM